MVKKEWRFTFIDGIAIIPRAFIRAITNFIGEHIFGFAAGVVILLVAIVALKHDLDPKTVLKILKHFGYAAGLLCLAFYNLIRAFVKSKRTS